MKRFDTKEFNIISVKLTIEERQKLDAVITKLKRSIAGQVKYWIDAEFDKLAGK